MLRAVGYHVPENSIAVVRRDQIAIGDGVRLTRRKTAVGVRLRCRYRRRTRPAAARRGDGAYRALVSRRLPGADLGPFRYAGTRPDDPNDLYAHEHRRELRALRVFAAWLNHDDSRSLNTRDTLVERDGRRRRVASPARLRIDARQRDDAGRRPRAGNEYLWESRPDVADDPDARPVRAPVDQGRISRLPRRSDASKPTSSSRSCGSRTIPTRRSTMRATTTCSGRPGASRGSPTT